MLRKSIALTLMLTMSLTSILQAAPRLSPTSACHNGLGIACGPKRVTYGYYPTLWRRWPTDHGPMPTVAEPEAAPPTAAGTEATQKAEEGPAIVPEKSAPPAAETQPKLEAEPGLPFDDVPPSPPADALPDATKPADDLPTDLPDPPAAEEPALAPESGDAAPEGAKSPASPSIDEDPFKDEPDLKETPRRGALRPREKAVGQRSTVRMRTQQAQATVPVRAPELEWAPAKTSNEPRRLPNLERESSGRSAAKRIEAANPLRADVKVAERSAMPASGWTVAPSNAGSWRANPLRAN